MVTERKKLTSQQRHRVFDAYRGRGRRNNDLWLIYSVKTDRDWILTSSRQLVHWLVFLETAPSVKSFDFDGADQNIHVVTVSLVSGCTEEHFISSENSPQANRLQPGVEEMGVTVQKKFFDDTQLSPNVPLAMRWLKALSFAAALRGREYSHVRLRLVPLLHAIGSGTLAEVLQGIEAHDEPLIIGMFVRLAIENHIVIDLSKTGLCYRTPWSLRERGLYVVA